LNNNDDNVGDDDDNNNKYLRIETLSMWNIKTLVIPVMVGAPGTISETFRKHLSNIPGNHIKEIHKTAILGTVHIHRKLQNFYHGK
jgi:hypothetical protein